MVTKINRRYSMFLVRLNAADSVSQQPEKVPRCAKWTERPKSRFPSSSVKPRSAMKFAFSGAPGETRENYTAIGQMG